MEIAEQVRFDFYEEERKEDFINCELTCAHHETGEYCMECVLADHYQGEYAEQVRSSANSFSELLDRVFGGTK